MKIRNGFVSNSSSSSFLILSKEKIENYKQLLEIFKINIESPLYEMNKNLVQTIYNITEEQDIDYIIENYCSYDESANDKYPTKEEFRNNMKLVYNDYNYFSIEELEKIKNGELFLREGSASDDSGNGYETLLYDLSKKTQKSLASVMNLTFNKWKKVINLL